MDAWSIGLTVLGIVALGLTVFGALYDRARNRRRTAEIMAPPRRVIPQFQAQGAGPQYVTELQARRRPDGVRATDVGDDARGALPDQLDQVVTVHVGYASRDFVTDETAGIAVLDTPAVLVCGDPVTSVRELLAVLERSQQDRRPLVIVAPALDPDVLATLEVNQIQRKLALLVVLAPDSADRQTIVETTGGTTTERSDRQAGYVPPEHLGRCARWVSTAKASQLYISAPQDHPT